MHRPHTPPDRSTHPLIFFHNRITTLTGYMGLFCVVVGGLLFLPGLQFWGGVAFQFVAWGVFDWLRFVLERGRQNRKRRSFAEREIDNDDLEAWAESLRGSAASQSVAAWVLAAVGVLVAALGVGSFWRGMGLGFAANASLRAVFGTMVAFLLDYFWYRRRRP